MTSVDRSGNEYMTVARASLSMPIGIIVAIKSLRDVKTRLSSHYDYCQRQQLAVAMFRDTLSAVTCTAFPTMVVVISPDKQIATIASEYHAHSLVDQFYSKNPDGLNAAIRQAERYLHHHCSCIVALPADLPALKSSELDQAITAAQRYSRSFIADRHHQGTTALFGCGHDLVPQFSSQSARLHECSGAMELVGSWPGLCCDIDTVDDLIYAQQLGLGASTSTVVHKIPGLQC